MIKNIVFDWAGVIHDSFHTGYQAIMGVFRRHGVPEITPEEVRREWVQPYMLFYNKYFATTLEQEKGKYVDSYREAKEKFPPRLLPGMKVFLRRLQEAKIKMIIVSGDPTEHLLPEIEEYGVGEFFETVYSDVHDKRIGLTEVLDRHGFDPAETIFIGDTNHEIESGKSVGMKTLAVTWGYQTEESLRSAEPDYVVRNLEELEKIIFND